jgi:hypothetical protein
MPLHSLQRCSFGVGDRRATNRCQRFAGFDRGAITELPGQRLSRRREPAIVIMYVVSHVPYSWKPQDTSTR